MKPIAFLGSSLDDLRAFPQPARQQAGYQLDRIGNGLEPDDCKPMPDLGNGVMELRVWDEAGTYRVMYIAKFADAVYVLHCFQKKTQQTSQRDKELVRKRYKVLQKEIAK